MRRLSAIFVLSMTVSIVAQSAAISDRDWKRWLADVDPLLTAAEKTEAKKTPAQARETFREAFWARRNPNAAGADNPQRAEFERRMAEADKSYRYDDGAWNDCGRAFVLFGKPDKIDNRLAATHFAADDRLKALREEDDVLAQTWFYRNPPGLVAVGDGYRFGFSQNCQTMNGRAFDSAVKKAAESYITAK